MKVQMLVPDDLKTQMEQMMYQAAAESFKKAAEVNSLPDWLKLKEAAKYANISNATLHNFINAGLKVCIIDGISRISKTEIDRFYKEHAK
ncbi:MAG: helix-turn-helix domain-containing protein [Bacillota bacterium]|nr:helix-turn-helix domain-containing protein [Bacillota bacterium]